MKWANDGVTATSDCKAGRGVRTVRAFQAGETVESCPVLVVPQRQLEALDTTDVYSYYYDWSGDAAVALGYGSLYNHSKTPNADYILKEEQLSIAIVAVTDIAEGEEVTIDYSRGGSNPLWFDPMPED